MEKPASCIKCPACKSVREFSIDGFDRGSEMVCGFTNKIIDEFYEHPGNEFIDNNVDADCPL